MIVLMILITIVPITSLAYALPTPTSTTAAPTTSPSASNGNPFANAVQTVENAQAAQKSAENVWQSINGWLQAHIGLSLTQIIQAVGTAVIWVLNLAIQILQAIIHGIQWFLAWIS